MSVGHAATNFALKIFNKIFVKKVEDYFQSLSAVGWAYLNIKS
jgi:hypothetical protein